MQLLGGRLRFKCCIRGTPFLNHVGEAFCPRDSAYCSEKPFSVIPHNLPEQAFFLPYSPPLFFSESSAFSEHCPQCHEGLGLPDDLIPQIIFPFLRRSAFLALFITQFLKEEKLRFMACDAKRFVLGVTGV